MDKLTRKVADTLLDWGADLVGVAPVTHCQAGFLYRTP
jgi:hypothetical protein